MSRRTPDHVRELVRRMWQEGERVPRIGQKTGLSEKAIANITRDLPRRHWGGRKPIEREGSDRIAVAPAVHRHRGGPNPLTRGGIDAIKALTRRGLTMQRICTETGFSENAVKRYRDEALAEEAKS